MRLLFITILGCILATTHAQEGFRAGLVGGLATSQVSGDGLSGFNKVGPYIGGFVHRDLTAGNGDGWSFQLEIAYTQKGSRKRPKADEGNLFYTLKLNYMEVPVLAQYQLGKFRYEFGPSVGALLGYQEYTHIGDLYPARPFNKVALSFNAGIGFNITEKLGLTWRFNNSVIPIRKHAGNATWRLNLGQYNTVVNFLWHYRF